MITEDGQHLLDCLWMLSIRSIEGLNLLTSYQLGTLSSLFRHRASWCQSEIYHQYSQQYRPNQTVRNLVWILAGCQQRACKNSRSLLASIWSTCKFWTMTEWSKIDLLTLPCEDFYISNWKIITLWEFMEFDLLKFGWFKSNTFVLSDYAEFRKCCRYFTVVATLFLFQKRRKRS